jgi:hypothetical protein
MGFIENFQDFLGLVLQNLVLAQKRSKYSQKYGFVFISGNQGGS